MDNVPWVYDLVMNLKTGEIVALMYHPDEDPVDCLQKDEDALSSEGLIVLTSEVFSTLAEARQHAWCDREKFAKDLD